jgi:transcriptional regulator GlxA family with amidase domain
MGTNGRGTRKTEPTRVVVLVMPGVHILDLAGAVQVFDEANDLGAGYALGFHGIAPEAKTAQGLLLAGLTPPPEPRRDDLVLLPGRRLAMLDRVDDVPVAWLRRALAAGCRVASVCSGAFALGAAGLLDGRACTTHWLLTDRLQRLYPTARVRADRLYVRDATVITSAGIAAGIDMALALVEEDHGPTLVGELARRLVVYLRRDGDREQTSVFLQYRTHDHPGVHRAQDWLVAYPDRRPTLDGLAEVAGMSPRNLSRAFKRATGVTPRGFAVKLKLRLAQDLLTGSHLGIGAIAARCGFEDRGQLRRLWKKNFGVNLVEWRRAARLGG